MQQQNNSKQAKSPLVLAQPNQKQSIITSNKPINNNIGPSKSGKSRSNHILIIRDHIQQLLQMASNINKCRMHEYIQNTQQFSKPMKLPNKSDTNCSQSQSHTIQYSMVCYICNPLCACSLATARCVNAITIVRQ